MRYIIGILGVSLVLLSSCEKMNGKESPVESESPMSDPILLHPSFNLSENTLRELCSDLEENEIKLIMERPEYFLQLIHDIKPWDSELVTLVNKETGLESDDIPADLVSLDEYGDTLLLSRGGHRLSAVTLPSLLAMVEKAGQSQIDLMISSTYRSYDYQEGLYNRYVERDGQEAADRYSARPGKSQHQLGTVIDFGSIDDSFASTDGGRWLKENAWRYGFSLSYPEGLESVTGYIWESWHYRYIGEEACRLEKEFFMSIQENMLSFLHKKSSLLEAAYIPD